MEEKPKRTLLTPATEAEFFTRQILAPLLRGESLTTIWVPHLGKRSRMYYLTQNADRFGFKKLGKYTMFYIDRSELMEESSSGYFSLIEYYLREKFPKSLPPASPQNGTSVALIRKAIAEQVKDGWHLIFILGKFDELQLPRTFYNNLESIWEIDKRYVHFIFLSSTELTKPGRIEEFDLLKEALVQNVLYVPLLSSDDSSLCLNGLCQKYSYNLASKQQKLVLDLGGGLPRLIKALCRLVPQIETNEGSLAAIAENQEVSVILEDVWDALDEDSQNAARLIAQGEEIPLGKLPYRLAAHQLAVPEGKGFKLFTPLFAQFIKSHHRRPHHLSVDKVSGQILLDNLPVAEKFTLQEYHLLVKLLSEPERVFSRDEIAEALWGKESFEKYSDWAIDQIVSQARKKLINTGVPATSLQTIRGRGYRWLAREHA